MSVLGSNALAWVVFGLPLPLALCMLLGLPQHVGDARRTRWFAVVATLGAVSIVVALFARWILPPEMPLDFARCEKIVQAIEAGTLAEKPSGTLELPPELADATYDGKIYVTHRASGSVYLFKSWQARLRTQRFRGFIYSTVPRKDMDALTPKKMASVFVAVNYLSGIPLRPQCLDSARRKSQSWFRLAISSGEKIMGSEMTRAVGND